MHFITQSVLKTVCERIGCSYMAQMTAVNRMRFRRRTRRGLLCWAQYCGMSCTMVYWLRLRLHKGPQIIEFTSDIALVIRGKYVWNYFVIWSLQPFSQFIHNWRDLQLKVDSERQIFWETYHGNFIYSQSFFQKSAYRKSPKNYFLFIFHFDASNRDTNPGFTSNKSTH